MKKILMVCVASAALAACAEKMQVYPPARTLEEKIALAERTLEYVAKSVPANSAATGISSFFMSPPVENPCP